jgi:hypothetical protein
MRKGGQGIDISRHQPMSDIERSIAVITPIVRILVHSIPSNAGTERHLLRVPDA